MIDIATYRIRIGLFNRIKIKISLHSNGNWNISATCLLNILSILLSLLIICGDIHPNPGPDINQTPNSNRSNSSISSSDVSNNSSGSSIFRTSNKKLSLVHMNSQSIRKKIDTLEIESSAYDIVCLSETWLNSDITNSSISFPGFHEPFRKDRDDGYGGVAIYVNERLIVKEMKTLNIDG